MHFHMKCNKFPLSLLFLLCLTISLPATSMEPVHLTCEYRVNPLGIDMRMPRLGWQLAATGRNQSQTGYEIIVDERMEEVKAGRGHSWTTGIVSSNRQHQIEYKGNALRPFTRYYWRVRTYDQENKASSWSDINWFETAMLEQSDWSARWIGDERPGPQRPEDYFEPDPMPLLQTLFSTKKKISSARLYVSGMGYYEAYINGKRIGDQVLDPGWTAYGKQVFYMTYDISSLIQRGINVAGVQLGNGWWNPSSFKLFGRFDLRDYQQTGRPCVKAEIHLRYTDGTVEKILTDEQWLTAPGPVIRNNVYLGEHYDARKEQPGWMNKKVPGTSWTPAVIVAGPAGVLTAQAQPPIRITRIISPKSITEVGKDTFIVDMGQNFAGVARISVRGAAGTRITLRYGEGIFKDGSINLQTAVATQIKKGGIKGGPGAPETAWQEDSYTLKGEGTETWAPRFTFHGFQYIEITGWPGKPTLADIEGLRLNADLNSNGEFSCSNEMFNRLHEVIQWTFLSNVFSVQSDCPGREKMGYGADMVVSSDAFLYNYDMAQFYSKSVRDFANDQRPGGGLTEIAPSTGINDRGYDDSTGPLGWQLAFAFLQKRLYEFYGDQRIIEQQYPALQRQIAFLQTQAIDHLFYWDISDHEALDPKPESLSASLFYFHHVKLAAEFAQVLGKKDDANKYERLAQSIQRAIVHQYLVRGTGRFDNGTQSAQVLALWYGISPEPELSLSVLEQEVERHKGHLSTGIFSTKMLFDVCRTLDRNDIAYRIANQRDFPGWGNMLANAATTLWETWQFPETGPSRNHPMFGSIDEWFYRSLLGINAASPGFGDILIKPQPAGDLRWAKGSYASIKGEIGSSWEKNDQQFSLSVSIPPNTKAEIWIPARNGQVVLEDGKPISVHHYEKGYAIIKTGSGKMKYEVRN